MRVADGFAGGDELGDFIAAQQVPEPVAEHAAPDSVQQMFWRMAKCLDAVNAGRVQARFGAPCDAGEVAQLEFVEHLRKVLAFDDEQPIRLAHL